MNLFAKQKYRHRHREQTYGYQAEERGGGMNWEVGIYVYTVSSIQLLSHVSDFATPWTAARQASLSITNSCSLLKLMSTELVMPSTHLILCCPFSSCLQSFPAAQSFPMSQLFASGGQTIGAPASASALPMNIQG